MIRQKTLKSDIQGFTVKQYKCLECNEKKITVQNNFSADSIAKANIQAAYFADKHKNCKDLLR